MTKVLSKYYEFFFHAVLVVFKYLYIVDTLLQLFVVLLFKCIDIEDEKMSIVAADPGQIIVHSAAEKPMAACLLHYNGAQLLIVHMELVALASRKNQTRIIGVT